MRTGISLCCFTLACVMCLLAGCSETKVDERKNIRDDTVTNPPKRREYRNMVFIPAGEFMMSTGSTDRARRRVHLKPFYIDIYEVSNEDYDAFIRDGRYSRPEYWTKDGWSWRATNQILMPKWWKTGRYRIGPMHPRFPVGGISWYEADAFARWAGKRLPTEAEWEKASRGTDGRLFPWGNDSIDAGGVFRANFEPLNDGNIYAGQIDSYPEGKSPWGCYNMLGNVWEWVADSAQRDRSWHAGLPERDPVYMADTGFKLLRGGSWYKGASVYDSFFRLVAEPGTMQYDDIGFRCARDAE